MFNSFADLPAYKTVLSAVGGPVHSATPVHERDFAVIQLSDTPKRALILKQNEASLQYLQHLRTKLASLNFETEVDNASHDVIADIYRNHKAAAQNENSIQINETEALKEFLSWLQQGVVQKATDIHISVQPRITKVRFRINNKLVEHKQVESTLAKAAISNAYTSTTLVDASSRSDTDFISTEDRSCMIIAECNVPESGPRLMRFRFQWLHSISGGRCIIRVPRIRTHAFTLEEMGYESSQIYLITRANSRRDGFIGAVGATCSGKTELLNSMHFIDPHRHELAIYEVGDPIEIENDEITQISIKRSSKSDADGAKSYAETARSLLRADPDKAIFSEIRGKDVGMVIRTIVQSGHQTKASFHASSWVDAISRLTSDEIGIPRDVVCSSNFINLIVFNALVPKLCPHCKTAEIPADLPDGYLTLIKDAFLLKTLENIRWANKEGCGRCRSGIAGLTVASEVVQMNRSLLELLRGGKEADAADEYRRQRLTSFDDPDMTGKTAFEHGLYKVLNGLVDPRDLEETFETFEEYAIKSPPARNSSSW